MTITVKHTSSIRLVADLLVATQFQGVKRLTDDAAEVDTLLNSAVSELLMQEGFEGKHGQELIFPMFGKIQSRKFALLGLGAKKNFDEDSLRRFGGQLVKLAEKAKVTSIVIRLPAAELDAKSATQAFAEGLLLSAYRFHTYHGKLRTQENISRTELQSVIICVEDARTEQRMKEGIARAMVLAEATNVARDLVNTPSQDMAPAQLVEAAKRSVGKGVSLTVINKQQMEELGMQAALAVARGSEHIPMGAHLRYAPRGAKKKIVVIGKAVTFDSGGLSIKPADAMMTMKIDMAGAAAVIGLFHALPKLGVNVEVHGIFLAVENMPGGNAYRPGDVVKAMDGTTIEVLNTDAEGRVTLADALCYAKSFEPDMIIDLATLTGACVVALGDEIAGLFSNNEKLRDRLLSASEQVGEALWEMPLYPGYRDHVKSKIADLKNIGQRGSAGAISAALFLEPFVGETPWAHLDIAGPSYTERETRPDQPYGGSGFGVRLLASFLEKL